MSRLSLRILVFLAVLPLLACSHPVDDDSSATGLARLGGLLREKGDAGTSIDFYRRALAKDPGNLVAIKGLSGALEQSGDKKGAAAVLKDGVVAHPDDGELHRRYGRLLIALEQPAEAKKQFEAALEVDGDDVKSRSGLGVALDYLASTKPRKKTMNVRSNPSRRIWRRSTIWPIRRSCHTAMIWRSSGLSLM